MKSEYEEEVYTYFTQPKNFKTMLKVAEHSGKVTKRLIESFWSELEAKLRDKLQPLNTGWTVEISNTWDYKWIKLRAFKESWKLNSQRPEVAFAFECIRKGDHPYVGINIHRDSTNIDVQKMRSLIIDLEELKSYETDANQSWARWKFLSFILDKEDLCLLLPSNREETLNSLAEEVLLLIDLVSDKIDRLIDECKLN